MASHNLTGNVPTNHLSCRCTNSPSMFLREWWRKSKSLEWWKIDKEISGQWMQIWEHFQVRMKCLLRCLVQFHRWLRSKLRKDRKEKLPTECGCNTIRMSIRIKYKLFTKINSRKRDKLLKNSANRLWIFQWKRTKIIKLIKLDPSKTYLRMR